VAKLADAQPSEGCDRKVMEVQLLSSAPNRAMNMKLYRLSLLFAVLTLLLSPRARAQFGKAIDPTKKADVGGKSVGFGEAQFQMLSQPTRDLPNSALIKDDLKFQDVDTKGVELNSLQFSSVTTTVIPKANFTAKRIADKVSDSTNQLDHVKKNAPINNRQIRAFTTGGESELKQQLNEPH
jgi:hypothetical protein